MAENTIVSELLRQNKAAVKNYQPAPLFSELPSLGLPMPRSLILTCVDPRISPEKFLDLGPGQFCPIIPRQIACSKNRNSDYAFEAVGPIICRNVCGHVAPALSDIVALDSLIGLTDIIIIHHTDCGSLMMKDENIRNYIKKEFPKVRDVDSMTFGGIVDVEQSVKDDLAVLKASPLIRKELHEHSYGVILDIKTGVFTSV